MGITKQKTRTKKTIDSYADTERSSIIKINQQLFTIYFRTPKTSTAKSEQNLKD